MDQSIQDGIGKGRLTDYLVPGVNGELAGDEGGAECVAIFEDLQEVMTLLVGEPAQAPVVEDKEIGPGETGQKPPIPAVRFGDMEVMEEAGHAGIEGDERLAGLGIRIRGSGPKRAGSHLGGMLHKVGGSSWTRSSK